MLILYVHVDGDDLDRMDHDIDVLDEDYDWNFVVSQVNLLMIRIYT